MGKQIHFLHLEEDALLLFRKVEAIGGVVALRGGNTVSEEEFCCLMSQRICKLYILPASEMGNLSDLSDQILLQGMAIELMNCNRGNPTSRTYESGRLYVTSSWTDGTYDEAVLRMYNTLCGFLRRNYTYSRNTGIYYSCAFKREYDLKNVAVAQLNRPIQL